MTTPGLKLLLIDATGSLTHLHYQLSLLYGLSEQRYSLADYLRCNMTLFQILSVIDGSDSIFVMKLIAVDFHIFYFDDN